MGEFAQRQAEKQGEKEGNPQPENRYHDIVGKGPVDDVLRIDGKASIQGRLFAIPSSVPVVGRDKGGVDRHLVKDKDTALTDGIEPHDDEDDKDHKEDDGDHKNSFFEKTHVDKCV